MLGLKIVTPEGRPLSLGQAVGRYFAMLLSGLVRGSGFMPAGWDERNPSLQDRLGETRVIRDRREALLPGF